MDGDAQRRRGFRRDLRRGARRHESAHAGRLLECGALPEITVQITVNSEVLSEVLSPRRRLLVVPYAIRAESANTAASATTAAHANTADSATTATTATTALNVGGISADFVSQVYQYADFDGNGLLNSNAKEGLGELDGDGLANFIDPDNDGDGLSDATEVAQGSDPNQLTATLTGFTPPPCSQAPSAA